MAGNINILSQKRDSFLNRGSMMPAIPDLIIGIDVGTSCTGVAFFDRTNGSLSDLVRVFNRWPGSGGQFEMKVPTRLTYQSEAQDRPPIRWGFQSNPDCEPDHEARVKDGFKIDFGCLQAGDQGVGDPQARFRSARKSMRHYLQKVYDELEAHFTTHLQHRMTWNTALVHFVFSYPATWFEETLEEFKDVIREAGFGQATNHEVSVSLTEPNAVASAAAYEGTGSLENGEIVLVVDAGGGTVDLTLLQINESHGGVKVMDEIRSPTADTAGAVYIDLDFQDLALDRLIPLADQLQPHTNPERVAWSLARGVRFQSNKHDFGRTPFEDGHFFSLGIPLRDNVSSPNPDVEGRDMLFTFGELKRIFNNQVDRIFQKIERTLENMDLSTIPNGRKALARILFSGGLTNSVYVQKTFRSWKNTKGISADLVFVEEPQTAVCKGLVYEAKQRLVQGRFMFPHFLMRSSLGFPYRERLRWYKSNSRKLKKEAKGLPADFVGQGGIDCIDWFIQKDEKIKQSEDSETVIRRKLSMVFDQGDLEDRRFTLVLVTSSDDKPPRIMPTAQSTQVQRKEMIVDLRNVKPKNIDVANDGWYQRVLRKAPVDKVWFTLKVTIQPSAIDVQCVDCEDETSVLSEGKPMTIAVDVKLQEGEKPRQRVPMGLR